jgi:hypothetical protein
MHNVIILTKYLDSVDGFRTGRVCSSSGFCVGMKPEVLDDHINVAYKEL